MTEASSLRNGLAPRSLMRVLRLFELLSRAPQGVALSELSAELETPQSSLLNLLRPLLSDGYLENISRRYRLGSNAYQFFARIQTGWDFQMMIRPFLEELAEKTQETVMLGVLSEDVQALTYISIIDSPHPIRYKIEQGTTRPLHLSAAGRIFLAFSERDRTKRYLDRIKLQDRSEKTAKLKWLREEIDKIRQSHLSVSKGQYIEGLSAVAAPVFDGNDRCIAALSIVGPAERIHPGLDELAHAVTEVAARASGLGPPWLRRTADLA